MINKVLLIGNLGREPELRHTQSGTAVASFSIATSENWTDNEGNKQESTEWHNIIAWKRLAELCSEYLKKGSRVYVEGKISTRKWKDQDGDNRYTTEIVAREIKFLSPLQGSGFEFQGDNYGPPPPMGNDVPF